VSEIKSSTIERVLAAAGILAGSLGAFAVGYFNPSTSGFFPVCPLHSLTGLNCPGCGLTRGFHSLFHGDIFSALQFNLMLPIYLMVFIYIGISLLLIVFRGRGLSYKLFAPTPVYIFFIVSFAFGILRNLPFYPFTIFSP
jgi:hypothetical protein